MPAPQVLIDSVGDWVGTSTLHCDWPPGNVVIAPGPSRIRVELINAEIALVTYDWEYEGKTERGVLIAAQREDKTTFGWSDSWHQNSEVMHLVGANADCKGSYQVGDYPEWFWRIAFSREGDTFKMEMFNISPEGEEDWAVRAEYTRA
jgi:hypothetical protein